MKNLLLIALLIPLFLVNSPERQEGSKTQNYTETLPGDVKLEMVAIPGGSFMMGSNWRGDQKPIHMVTLKPFYMGKYEITKGQWESVMGKPPSDICCNNLPVVDIFWEEAKEFCKKLSAMTGKEYRLPTEAEWEYAARAGSTGNYYFGDDKKMLKEYAWYDKNSGNSAHPVGQKKPNAWGLYDMIGNVNEWCEDSCHKNYKGAPTDGSAWVTDGPKYLLRDGSKLVPAYCRITRGGSYADYIEEVLRSAFRNNDPPARAINYGFRVVCGSPRAQ